ncbi:MAG: endolytic transglycosylase MltG [Tidjanibacter sp.]|nr:endolytic transglycosylase MltG [Tidjanibacter sp.]
MSRKSKRVVLWSVAAVVAVVLAGVVSVEVAVRQKCVPSVATVRIPSNATYAALLDSLRSGGVERVGVVDFWGRVRRLDSSFKGGNYRFGTDATPRSLVGRLRSGDQTPVRITFNNVGSLGLLASRLSTQIEADSATIAAHLLAPETAENYGFSTETFLSMFIPDTYEVWWTLSPKALTDRMKTEYDRFWNSPDRAERLKELKLTATEVYTLASIVYQETTLADEMPRIAGVYMNRLHRGIPLQACPTVKFALGEPGLRRVLYKHTRIDSPYNTYINRGLPPGPIAMPSKAAIEAVLNYEHNDYLYFCAADDFSGRNLFAKTLAEHNRNARRYAAALNSAGIR